MISIDVMSDITGLDLLDQPPQGKSDMYTLYNINDISYDDGICLTDASLITYYKSDKQLDIIDRINKSFGRQHQYDAQIVYVDKSIVGAMYMYEVRVAIREPYYNVT